MPRASMQCTATTSNPSSLRLPSRVALSTRGAACNCWALTRYQVKLRNASRSPGELGRSPGELDY
eukprot:12102413-Alexandrium_andersonii.AAC.1